MESIIVYRNPLEAALWEAVMNIPGTGYLAPALVGFLTGLVVYALVLGVGARVAPAYQYRTRNNPLPKIAAVLAWIAGLAVCVNMLRAIF